MESTPTISISRFDLYSFWIFVITIFLTPIFFIPFLGTPLAIGKVGILTVGLSTSFLLWIIARFREGVFIIPRSYILASACVVAFFTLISSVLSDSLRISLFGQMGETGTFLFVSILVFTIVMTAIHTRTQQKVFLVFSALISSLFIVIGYQALKLIPGLDFLSFGIFEGTTTNLIGKWNDVAVAGGVFLLALAIILDTIKLRSMYTFGALLTGVIALFTLAHINFIIMWYCIGIFALMHILVRLVKSRSKLPYWSAALVLLSVIFILFGFEIAKRMPISVSDVEVRPSIESTYEITKTSLKEDLIFGKGANMFLQSYLQHKPNSINNSVFWNFDFNQGFGYIPTSLVTNGIMGFAAWMIFIVLSAVLSLRLIFRKSETLPLFGTLISLVTFLFITLAVIYIPGPVVLILTFVSVGLAIGIASQEKLISTMNFKISEKSRHFQITAYVLLCVVPFVLIIAVGQKVIASSLYQNGVNILNSSGALDVGESRIKRAASIDAQSAYYRTLSDIGIIKMSLFAQNSTNSNSNSLQEDFQRLLSDTEWYAQKAAAINPIDYQNWLHLGKFYESLIPLQVENATKAARESYGRALVLNPKSPALYYRSAQLEAMDKNYVVAKDLIAQSLKIKNNFTEAYFLLSQIDVQEGNIKKAIANATQALSTDPTNSGILFHLGVLHYNDTNYRATIELLEKAVALNDQYSNARYFLGLSYSKERKVALAIEQFEKIEKLNPENLEVKSILSNLRAGRSPFAGQNDNKPEQRKNLPIRE